MKQIKTVLLAGGVGKRFWPIQTSKVTMPFFGKPLIAFVLEELKSIGLSDSIVVTNSIDEPEIKKLGVKTAIQKDPKGMGDALLAAKSHIGNNPIVVKNALDLFDEGLYKRVAKKIQDNRSFVVAKKNDTYFDGGYYKLDNKKIVGIVEKPGKGNEPSNLIDVVFHYFQNPKEFFALLENTKSDRDDVYEKALDAYIAKNSIDCIVYEGFWQPVKYPEHVLDVTAYLLKKVKNYRGKNVQIRPNVIIEGTVYIEDNVKIFENTKIVGPTFIGKNTIVGNNNIIRESIINENCVTGFNTDITRSYIGKNCWFHSNYVGDSVLDANVSLGSGTVLANLRLDEGTIKKKNRTKLGALIGRNVRIGVNVSVMPGVKIGENSFVGAGVVLGQDLPGGSFCSVKQSLEIKKNTKTALPSREEFRKKI